jgi:hypothetical protein
MKEVRRITHQDIKPGDLFVYGYQDPAAKIEIVEFISRKEGYTDNYGYSDPNGDTIRIRSLTDGEYSDLNSRSRFTESFIWGDWQFHRYIERLFAGGIG